jgi:tetratricopeptide (TPR) repeat protein
MVVREALCQLSEKTRLTVTLYYISGRSHAEIARFLEIPLNTVRSRLQHAKRQLREEMMAMAADVLNEGKPGPQFTRRVVKEALRRAAKSEQAHALGEALGHYDDALTALDGLAPTAEHQRLKMEALRKKAAASRFTRGFEEANRLYEQSLAVAEELGDRKSQADKLMLLGTHALEQEKARDCFNRALKIYREIDAAAEQGECLYWLGTQNFFMSEAA